MLRNGCGAKVRELLGLKPRIRTVAGLAVGVAVLSVGSSAAADVSTVQTRKLVAALDKDRDGQVSRTELLARFRRNMVQRVGLRFSQLDRDADGRVTPSEVTGMNPDRFARFDLNHDGAFTRLELTTVMEGELQMRLSTLLVTIDVDGDRVCSAEELHAHRGRLAQRRQATTDRVARRSPEEAPRVRVQVAGAETAADQNL